MPLMSIRGYARERGVNDKTIRKAIQAGKIPLVGGMIDPDLADASWARNRDGGQTSKLADAACPALPVLPHQPAVSENETPAGALVAETPASAGALASGLASAQQPELDMAPLTIARIENTRESTALKEIARRKLEGSLLEAEEVERTWGELLQVVKDRLRLIPDDIAPALLACTDEAEIRSILTREILTAFGGISKGVAGMVAA